MSDSLYEDDASTVEPRAGLNRPFVKSNELQDQWVIFLEQEWTVPTGFLIKVRAGNFDSDAADKFVAELENIHIPDGALNRRLVKLLWFIPLFLSWQTVRVSEKGTDTLAYQQFCNRVLTHIGSVLGLP